MRFLSPTITIRWTAALLGILTVTGCALFQNIETPYFSFSYYVLSYAETETVINQDRANTANSPNPPPLTLIAWRTAVLDAAQAARNGAIHPGEIADFVLTQLGSDPARHPDFGVEGCSASADMASLDFEVPGDETNLGGVTLQTELIASDSGRLVCNAASNLRPNNIDALGPQNWPNGSEQTMITFIVRIDGVDWTTNGLANKVAVTFDEAADQGAGSLWFMAADQTQGGGWVNAFDTVIVAPLGGFVLVE
jgi:hypothetical protein